MYRIVKQKYINLNAMVCPLQLIHKTTQGAKSCALNWRDKFELSKYGSRNNFEQI